MTQIYGNKGAQGKVNYPSARRQNSIPFAPSKSFVASGSVMKDDSMTRRPVKIQTPQFKSQIAKKAPVDAIPKRRSEETISKEMSEIKMRQQYYRPPPIKAISSENEKERLRQINTYKGGKGLPEELTQPVGEAPFERIQRVKEEDRMEQVRQRRNPGMSRLAASAMSVEEELAQHVMSEIEERRAHLAEMRTIRALSAVEETKLLSEIQVRVNELKKYDA